MTVSSTLYFKYFIPLQVHVAIILPKCVYMYSVYNANHEEKIFSWLYCYALVLWKFNAVMFTCTR